MSTQNPTTESTSYFSCPCNPLVLTEGKGKHAIQTFSPHIVRDTCFVNGKHYYSAITCTGKHCCSLHWRLPNGAEGEKKNELHSVHLSQ